MRRLLLAGLLFATACLGDGTSPTSITGIVVNNDASPLGVFAGDQVQLNAEAHDPAGDIVPVTFTYTSSNTSVATVDVHGLITAIGAGTSTIRVATIDQSATFTLTVDGNISKSIVISPPAVTMSSSQTVQLAATVYTTLNNPARGKSVAWSSSSPAVVSVDTTGLITSIAATPGVSVCAAATDAPAVKACITVIVQPPASASLRR